MARPLVSPDDQRATFVELFFDLVFVFCVTQVVTLLHGHIDGAVDIRIGLAAGAVLFVSGTGAALWRATGRLLLARLVLPLSWPARPSRPPAQFRGSA